MELRSGNLNKKEVSKRKEMASKSLIPSISKPKVGKTIYLQFIGIKSPDDAYNGLWCHTVNMPSSHKPGKSYAYTIPCLSSNSDEEVRCPLCESKESTSNTNFNDPVETKVAKTVLVSPYIVIDMNKKWDKEEGKFIPMTEMRNINGVEQEVELEPQLKRFMCDTNRFREGLAKFIEENGDISGKVIAIAGVYKDKNGNIIEKGQPFDKYYTFAFSSKISPVDESQFEIPDVSEFFNEFNEEAMDRYLNTHKFYEPKSQSDNVRESSDDTGVEYVDAQAFEMRDEEE